VIGAGSSLHPAEVHSAMTHLLPFTDQQVAVLRAALDCMIPPDDFPGAWDAGVGDYLARQFASDLASLREPYAIWLDSLDAECRAARSVGFADLDPLGREALLMRIEDGEVATAWPLNPQEFISLLARHAAEGYYSDPANGGNRDAVSWTMVGFRTNGPLSSRESV
jgi:hypothetical protein